MNRPRFSGCFGVAVGEFSQDGSKFWRIEHGEWDVEVRDVANEIVQGVAASFQNAVVFVDGVQQSGFWRKNLSDGVDGPVQLDVGLMFPCP